jgi:hypothetical protein
MTWCPCTAVVGHSDITLVDFDEAVEGQPSFSGVDALHVLQAYYDCVHERHKNVCRLLRKAIIWVRSLVTASCAALVT